MSATFTDDEIETLRKGAMGAGLLVSTSDRGFFDTFKEAGALSKHVAAAHEHSDSALVKQIAEGHGTGFGVTTSIDKVEAETLDSLRSGVRAAEGEGARGAGGVSLVRARAGALGCRRGTGRRRGRGCRDREDRAGAADLERL